MKIRTDYVTNSSSSSFILGFNSKEEIPEKLMSELPSYLSLDTIRRVISDVEEGIVTKEVVTNLISQNVQYDVYFNDKPFWFMSWEERQSEEAQEFIQEEINERRKELDEYDIISIVEYEDHTDIGSTLEHRIMPNLNCTIRRISHH